VLFFRYTLEARGVRTPEDVLPLYREAAQRLGLQNADPAAKTVEGWFYEGRKPQRVFRPVVVEMLGYSIEALWTEVPEGTTPNFVPLSATSPTALHADAGVDLIEMKRTGAMAVRRAKEFLLGKDRETVGDDTLGLLDDEVARLAAAYPREPLSAIWDDLLETQDQVFRLLEGGRVRPSQLRDLNVKGAVLSFLVAKGFNDMEVPHQAMTMTRVAASCARDAEHPGLIALTDGLKSLIAYWADKPEDAYHYASQGVETAADLRGTVGLWLLGLQARAAAVLSDEETVRAANQRATDRREHVVHDDLDQLGGLFTYAPEKQLYYAVESEALPWPRRCSAGRAGGTGRPGIQRPHLPELGVRRSGGIAMRPGADPSLQRRRGRDRGSHPPGSGPPGHPPEQRHRRLRTPRPSRPDE
jgi:hypothetical protein